MTELEILAAITGIIGVALQAREKIIAWPFAIVSVSILAYVFFMGRLYSDFGLHIVYIGLNIFGWVKWSQHQEDQEVIETKVLPFISFLNAIAMAIMGAVIIGYIMSRHTDADLPYIDAFTTSGSLVAQYLLAKKYLQNWWLWIIVDIIAIPVYIYKELYIIAGLFAVFLVLCIYGYISWSKKYIAAHAE